MKEAALPAWVRKKKRKRDEQNRQASEAEEKRLKAAQILQLEGPAFWKRFIEGLELNATACKQLSIRASVNPLHEETPKREGFQIKVALESLTPSTNYLDVFYILGSDHIKCFPREGLPYQIYLNVDTYGQIFASSRRRFSFVSAGELAEDIVEELVDSIGG